MSDDRTAYLGRFDPIVIPIILDLLADQGIRAMTKLPHDQPPRGGYNFFHVSTGADEVLVDADRVDDARRIVNEQLPDIVAQMSAELDAEFPEAPE